MVKEVDILFRIQKLQQGRGWVTLVTTTYLIHLAKRGMKKTRIPAKKGSIVNGDKYQSEPCQDKGLYHAVPKVTGSKLPHE